MSNPFLAFKVDIQMPAKELEEELKKYKEKIVETYAIYMRYYDKVKNVSAVGVRTKNGKMLEDILSRRYEMGLDIDKDVLSETELEGLLKNFETDNFIQELQPTETRNKQRMEEGKKLEMFYLSSLDVLDLQDKIDKAQRSYIESGKQDSSKMMDALLEIRFREEVVRVANTLATEMSSQGHACTAEEFREILLQYKPYVQLKEIYGQINSKEKRENFVPESYVMRNMSNLTQLSTISQETVERLVEREKTYRSEYLDTLTTRFESPDLIKELKLPENQKHDYSWGVILEKPVKLMQDEPVNTPIFKGKISVESIGSFTEHSLFKKKQFEKEREIKLRKTSKRPQKENVIAQRLKINQDEIKFIDQKTDEKYTHVVIRDYFYRHEACKSLIDHLYRVTKTDLNGVSKSFIIISPVPYTDFEEPRKREFIKNIYLSDYMLDIAKQNGGYAGNIIENSQNELAVKKFDATAGEGAVIEESNGFFVSNIYNYEEIASAVLFSLGERGNILDYRNPKEKRQYSEQTKEDLLKLLNKPERERLIDE